MRSRKDCVTTTAPAAPQYGALSVTAMEIGITKVLIIILATIFAKASELLRHEDLIVKMPGANDGSYIVAGHTNQIYCATPGKGGSFKCDQNCVNASTKICEHTIAVAEKYGKLLDFITWYKRFKSGTCITTMALGGAPKIAGRNPSTRKRSNRKRPSTTSLVDLLEDCNDQLEQSSRQNDVPPVQISTAHPVNHIISNNVLYYQLPIIQQNYQQSQVQKNSFFLKWIALCVWREKIKNPSKLAADKFVMAYKDIRQFRDPVTGVLRYSDAPQNVNLHLRSVCLRTRYPNFMYHLMYHFKCLCQKAFLPLHFQRLLSEFYCRP